MTKNKQLQDLNTNYYVAYIKEYAQHINNMMEVISQFLGPDEYRNLSNEGLCYEMMSDDDYWAEECHEPWEEYKSLLSDYEDLYEETEESLFDCTVDWKIDSPASIQLRYDVELDDLKTVDEYRPKFMKWFDEIDENAKEIFAVEMAEGIKTEELERILFHRKYYKTKMGQWKERGTYELYEGKINLSGVYNE